MRTLTKKRRGKKSNEVIANHEPYEPTERERAAVEVLDARERSRRPAPRFKVVQVNGASKLDISHADPDLGSRLMIASLGLPETYAYVTLVEQIASMATSGQHIEAEKVNGMLALVQAIEPRDPVEAMLASQMAAIHTATLKMARSLNHVELLPQQDSCSNALNKLARTFAAQMDALNRHRGKGQQAIRVEHVTVNGGQAIVGSNVAPAGGGTTISEDQPHASALSHTPLPALSCQDAGRKTVPSAESEGKAALSDARRR